LKFNNIRGKSELSNTLGEEEQKNVWIPNLLFENSQSGTFTENEPMSVLRVQHMGQPVTKFNFKLNEFEEFEGNANPLVYENNYDLKLDCEFELRNFPFDSQKCYITVRALPIKSFIL
jgi:hypothetical protein